MVVKTLGIIILLLTAFYYSRNRQKTEEVKYEVLAELCRLFSHIHKNIDCFAKPLNEICYGYTSPLLKQYGFFTLWRQQDLKYAVDSIPYISPPVRETLRQYAQSAGQGYKEEELRLCRFTREKLEEMLASQKEEYHTKNRMYRTLPYLLALSIVLLLY